MLIQTHTHKHTHRYICSYFNDVALMRIEVNTRRLCGNGFVAAALYYYAIMACDFGTVCVLRYAQRSSQQISIMSRPDDDFRYCDLLQENQITFCNHRVFTVHPSQWNCCFDQ